MYENRTNITWYGTASVRIASGSSQLIIDPFFPFPDSRVKVSDDAYSDCSSILVSHDHFDHIGSISRVSFVKELLFTVRKRRTEALTGCA